MIAVDDGGLAHFLGDPGRKIPDAHLKAVCKVGQNGLGCRYMANTAIGWVCAKHTPIKERVDEAVAKGVFIRNLGDNCEGLGSH